MSTDNSEQIGEWNGEQGKRWATMQQQVDALVVPFGDAAMTLAAPHLGERVIDIGCGCGETSFELARRVGAAGAVLGVDVSQPMLDVAQSQLGSAPGLQVHFRNADAAEADLPAGRDLLFSRFGVMFFSQPAPAFAHMRKSLRPGGRCIFVCWRTPRDNPWVMTPLSAARAAMNVTPPPPDPNAPGPFAFADSERLSGILAQAGFGEIRMQRFDALLWLGSTARAAAEGAACIGPVSRFVREMGAQHLATIVDAVERSLAPLAAPDGRIGLNGSTWIVSAVNPV